MTWEMFRQGPPVVVPPGLAPVPVAERRTRLQVRDLEASKLRHLRREARRRRVTLHGVVTSAAAHALALLLDHRRGSAAPARAPQAGAPVPLSISHAVDLRPFTRGAQRLARGEPAFAAASVQCRLTPDPRPENWALWREAHRSCLEVRREMKERRAHVLGFALVRGPIDVYRTTDGPRLGRRASLGISDLGTYPYPLDHGAFRIAELTVGGANHVAGDLLNLMVVAVDGHLRLVLMAAVPILKDEELAWLADATRAALEAAAEGLDALAEGFPAPS
jgi:hypothetical protein